MEIIPAVDLKGGKCVRLSQGEYTRVETYSEDPVKYAQRWEREGGRLLHVVDLDGARVGAPQPQNLDALRQILRRTKLSVEFGGGVRSAEIAERMLGIGVQRVILGTAAAQHDDIAREALDRFGDRVVIGIDARDGFVAVSGWMERLEETAVAFAQRVVGMGAQRIIFTDIARDGMLSGVNLVALRQMLDAVPVPIIASGGVTTVSDVHALKALDAPNLEAAIVGKALYSGAISLAEAIAAAA